LTEKNAYHLSISEPITQHA